MCASERGAGERRAECDPAASDRLWKTYWNHKISERGQQPETEPHRGKKNICVFTVK